MTAASPNASISRNVYHILWLFGGIRTFTTYIDLRWADPKIDWFGRTLQMVFVAVTVWHQLKLYNDIHDMDELPNKYEHKFINWVIAQPSGCSMRFTQGSGAAFRPA